MTKKDFYRIIIKLFGLYVGLNALVALPVTLFALMLNLSGFYGITVILSTAAVFAMVYVLIVKTDVVIKLFRLDRGFDTPDIVAPNFSEKGVINAGLIILGLYELLEAIPDVGTQLYYAFKASVGRNNLINEIDTRIPIDPNYQLLTYSIIQLLIGILIIMYRDRIVKIIIGDKKSDPQDF